MTTANTTCHTKNSHTPHVALFIKTYSQYGGVELFCYRLGQYLSDNGYAVTIYCGENKIDQAKSPDQCDHSKQTPTVKTLSMLRPGRFLKNLTLFSSAKKALGSLSPDTVSMCFGNMAGCDIYRSGGPHKDFLHRSLRAQRNTVKRLKKAASRMINPINTLMPQLDNAIHTHPATRRIIAISSKVRSAIISQYPQTANNIVVIPNGVNTSRFSPKVRATLREEARKQLNFPDGQHVTDEHTVIGFCSTNFELKGLDRLIKALSLLPHSYIAVIAGGRKSEKYQNYAESLGVGNRLIFAGKVNDMPRFYASLDVFCHPSFYDTFGSVVAEAMAMGVPAITTTDVGACDIITSLPQGKTGVVIDTDNMTDLNGQLPLLLADAITELTGEERAAAAPAECIAETVADDIDVFQRYREVIEEVRNEKRAASFHR